MTEPASCKKAIIVCSGDKKYPHPRVYLAMDGQGIVVCPYRGKRTELKDFALENVIS
jgi:uncharacterized Zn-finger protein